MKQTEIQKTTNQTRKQSPLSAEILKVTPVKKKTKQVINNVQEILGYTELHPDVVQKVLDLYEKVNDHESRMKTLSDLVDELKGLSLWEIQRMIERKK